MNHSETVSLPFGFHRKRTDSCFLFAMKDAFSDGPRPSFAQQFLFHALNALRKTAAHGTATDVLFQGLKAVSQMRVVAEQEGHITTE